MCLTCERARARPRRSRCRCPRVAARRANRPCERDERLAWGHCDRARCLTRAWGRELTVSRRIVNDREAFVDPTTELIR
jgi:hypothetical protein